MEFFKTLWDNFKESKKAWIITAIMVFVLLLGCGFAWGHSVPTEIEAVERAKDEKLRKDSAYQNICDEIEEKSDTYAKMQISITNQEKKISDNEGILEKINNHEKIINELNGTITKKQTEISDLSKKVDGLNNEISQKQAELNKLTGDIARAKGQPIELLSGMYTVGKDIPAGRYRISGSSNFIVYSVSGRTKINTILGDSFVGSGDYIGTLEYGDSIDNHAPATLTPIE